MRVILAYEVGGRFRQVSIEGTYTFHRCGYAEAFLRDESGNEVSVSLYHPPPFAVELESEEYLEGFHSLGDLAACKNAVPPNTTVVVIEGTYGENATVFHSNGTITAVRNNGTYQEFLGGNSNVQMGDGNTLNLEF